MCTPQTTKTPILGQKHPKIQQLEALTELILPYNFHLAGSPIAWVPKAQSCCPNPEAYSSKINPSTPQYQASLTDTTGYR